MVRLPCFHLVVLDRTVSGLLPPPLSPPGRRQIPNLDPNDPRLQAAVDQAKKETEDKAKKEDEDDAKK